MATSKAKNVLMVIAHNNFRDEEYTSAREAIAGSDTNITVASTVTEKAAGTQGLNVNPDMLIDDVNPTDYDAAVFIGGSGSSQYWHDIKAHEIATTLNKAGKTVAACSHATVTLAVAGILKEKSVTGHVTVIEKLQIAGANYTGKKVETDGNILTCTGTNAIKEFGESLKKALN